MLASQLGRTSLVRGMQMQAARAGVQGSLAEVALKATQARGFHLLRRKYDWVEPEAEELIAKAYERHKRYQEVGESFPPALSCENLEALGKVYHYEPKNLRDKIAYNTVQVLEKFMFLFFREKYDHHAVCLETVAAVPGIVASAHRHLRSLRTMKRDHGWIASLQEEAENERLHLLIWMQHTKPTFIERAFVMTAQAAFVTFYTGMYALSPVTAHRTVGYLEEAAHKAYNDYLEAIDKGDIPNVPALVIAKNYYHLPEDATLRDVVLHVRADECMHRDFNHHLSDLIQSGGIDDHPTEMIDEVNEMKTNKATSDTKQTASA
ncbi:Alternative oxidase, mitochondrial [Hondaea fermentalgiana]|uniref:Alternative oxidase, mitochondrial n=1 Tax=Hondaea fermentalgiana TaxID=2315210 RepID=A0A2R5FYU6_9STRA|nr:Alternative oxidase, mitochondrial [Hondaea fermentalgiana]|eukprot:GBG23900.1 Alternative oxidase, mitochondrial [Hondaea fermentalgiana]